MTIADFVDLWPLWMYLFGFTSTIIGSFAKGVYDEKNVKDEDFYMPIVGAAFLWPIVWLAGGGIFLGRYLKERKQRLLLKAEEQKMLEAKQAKLLADAGL